jgi:hypothetical protein
VKPADVVPTLDVIEDCVTQAVASLPIASVDEFAFDGGEETFGHCIGSALALAPDGEHGAVQPGEFTILSVRRLMLDADHSDSGDFGNVPNGSSTRQTFQGQWGDREEYMAGSVPLVRRSVSKSKYGKQIINRARSAPHR